MALNSTYKIYIITNDYTNEVVYVGCTRNLLIRRRQYEGNLRTWDTPICFYTFKHREDISIDVLEDTRTINKNKARLLEKFWIDQFRQWGFPLLNIKDNLAFKNNAFNIPLSHPVKIIRDDFIAAYKSSSRIKRNKK